MKIVSSQAKPCFGFVNRTKEIAECASREPAGSRALWKGDKPFLTQSAGKQRLDGDLELELHSADINWALVSPWGYFI